MTYASYSYCSYPLGLCVKLDEEEWEKLRDYVDSCEDCPYFKTVFDTPYEENE